MPKPKPRTAPKRDRRDPRGGRRKSCSLCQNKIDVIDVAPGYLRNYLAPRQLAATANRKTVEQAQRLMQEAEQALIDRAERASDIAALLGKTVLTIEEEAGPEGRLFGSVTQKEIV